MHRRDSRTREKGRLKMRRDHFETDPPGPISHGPDAAEMNKMR
ncbi:MAG: hypothetical protein RLY70_2366 [Planctomycetota bacterium]|jgi:hypothetical protein